MTGAPKTLDEARKLTYGRWGLPFREGQCAFRLWTGFHNHQCTRAARSGPDNLYCKQHAKKLGYPS